MSECSMNRYSFVTPEWSITDSHCQPKLHILYYSNTARSGNWMTIRQPVYCAGESCAIVLSWFCCRRRMSRQLSRIRIISGWVIAAMKRTSRPRQHYWHCPWVRTVLSIDLILTIRYLGMWELFLQTWSIFPFFFKQHLSWSRSRTANS